MPDKTKKDNFSPGSLVGFAVGLIMGVLLAPAKGKETREKIKKEYDEKIAPVLDKVSDRAKELSDPVKERFIERIDQIEQLTGDVEKKVESAVQKKVKEVKKRFFSGINPKKP